MLKEITREELVQMFKAEIRESIARSEAHSDTVNTVADATAAIAAQTNAGEDVKHE